mmetsp:Transcript_93/g.227  ORF Transcript_93/g.227 Transcript_93/m.227 type:complete len:290 (-) Transcript_93:1037-1906(-)
MGQWTRNCRCPPARADQQQFLSVHVAPRIKEAMDAMRNAHRLEAYCTPSSIMSSCTRRRRAFTSSSPVTTFRNGWMATSSCIRLPLGKPNLGRTASNSFCSSSRRSRAKGARTRILPGWLRSSSLILPWTPGSSRRTASSRSRSAALGAVSSPGSGGARSGRSSGPSPDDMGAQPLLGPAPDSLLKQTWPPLCCSSSTNAPAARPSGSTGADGPSSRTGTPPEAAPPMTSHSRGALRLRLLDWLSLVQAWIIRSRSAWSLTRSQGYLRPGMTTSSNSTGALGQYLAATR